MNAKGHRVVLNRTTFQRIARLQSDGAVECAENEGWPIVADPLELPSATASFGVIGRVADTVRRHIDCEARRWPGRSEAQGRARVFRVFAVPAKLATAIAGA